MSRKGKTREDYSKAAAKVDGSLSKPTKPPFGYYGAKQRIASRIIASLPPHNAWIEAFCGSAAITLAKPPAPIEVINDLDDQIVNLFEQLRQNPDKLCRAVALTPYARAEFQRARQANGRLSALEKARRFLVATMMTVNATVGSTRAGFSFSKSYAREGMEARACRWYNLPERLEKVVERLRNVRVENRDARELLDMFSDRPATLVYLDPPYFVKREHRYVIDAGDRAFHEKLLAVCLRSKCMLLISGYANELYDDTLSASRGWHRVKIQTNTRDTTGKDYRRTEVLWQNRQFVEAQASGRVPIRLTKKEKANNKINPSRTR